MQIQINTDNHVEGNQELDQQVKSVVEGTLGRFGNSITRVEVHLSNESSSSKSSSDDKRCLMEARLAGQQPISVSHRGATLEQALRGSVDKLARVLDDTQGRLKDSKRSASYSVDRTT